MHRYKATFASGQVYTFLGHQLVLDPSASTRIESLRSALKKWVKNPVFGDGVPGGYFLYEVQYSRLIRETGLLGLLVFVWLMARLYKAGMRSYANTSLDEQEKGLSLGFICSLTGLLVMGFAAEVFIIIRIMEPFWFLAAIIVMLPETSKTA
jgi:O-antigen ligase